MGNKSTRERKGGVCPPEDTPNKTIQSVIQIPTLPVSQSLGIFWDIENVGIPAGKPSSVVAKQLRDFIADKHPDCGFAKEFVCVCDVRRLDPTITDGLDRNGVIVVHVNSIAKNAADDKLQELIDQFVDKFGANTVLVVITGDINFAKPIRNALRKGLTVVLIHGQSCSLDLKNLVKESYLFDDVLKNIHSLAKDLNQLKTANLRVSGLPTDRPIESISRQLTTLCKNCGGKPLTVANGQALVRFGCLDDAQRCLQRISGAEVFGHKITARLVDNEFNLKKVSQPTIPPNHCSDTSVVNSPILKAFFAQTTGSTTISTIPALNVRPIATKSIVTNIGPLINTSADTTVRTGSVTTTLSAGTSDITLSTGTTGMKTISTIPQINVRKVLSLKSIATNIGPLINTSTDTTVRTGSVATTLSAGTSDITLSTGTTGMKTIVSTDTIATTLSTCTIDKKQVVPKKKIRIPFIEENCQSIITGLGIQTGKRPIEVVRKLVTDWNDSKYSPDFITFVRWEGKSSIFVTATCAKTNFRLLNGARHYLTAESGIKWRFHHIIYECKSLINGLWTISDENVKIIVCSLVKGWNDSQISPKFIKSVERDPNFVDIDGEVGLAVTANCAEQCRALVNGAKQYLAINGSGIVWKQMCSQYSTTARKSIIEGLVTKTDKSLTKVVRNLVNQWKDSSISASFVVDVERMPNYPDSAGIVPLIVLSSTITTNTALIEGAKKYLNKDLGIIWTKFSRRSKFVTAFLNSSQTNGIPIPNIPLNEEVPDFSESDHSVPDNSPSNSSAFTNDDENLVTIEDKNNLMENIGIPTELSLNTGADEAFGTDLTESDRCSTSMSTSSSKPRDLSNYPMFFKSIITGLKTTCADNVLEIVRKLVTDWNDRLIDCNFIVDAERHPSFDGIDGKADIIVISKSPQTCKALVKSAGRYMSPLNGIKWTFFKAPDDHLSAITGLDISIGENCGTAVRRLVMKWKDLSINGNFIVTVERVVSLIGKQLFIVTAASPRSNNALVMGAQKYLKPNSGIKWVLFDPNVHKSMTLTVCPPPQTLPKSMPFTAFPSSQSMPKSMAFTAYRSEQYLSKRKREVRPYLLGFSFDEVKYRRSIITGLETNCFDSPAKVVRKLVMDWNVPSINGNLIVGVERDPSFAYLNGKAKLTVLATNERTSKALVDCAKRYLLPLDGIEWTLISPRAPPDCLSVIIGPIISADDNMSKAVRKLVMQWNDRSIQANFIVVVEQIIMKSTGINGYLVTATSPQTNTALVSGAKRYSILKWVAFDQKIHKFIKSNPVPSAPVSPVNTIQQNVAEIDTPYDERSVIAGHPVPSAPVLPVHTIQPNLAEIDTLYDERSVITGLATTCFENPIKVVRKLVTDWNDPSVNANSIVYVERDPSFAYLNGKADLTVFSISVQTSRALVEGAIWYISRLDGIKWELINKPRAPADCWSVITSDMRFEDSLLNAVRQTVVQWNDPSIHSDFIVDVERKVMGTEKICYLVKATSAQTKSVLVLGAKRHSAIKWDYFDHKIHTFLEPNAVPSPPLMRSNAVPSAPVLSVNKIQKNFPEIGTLYENHSVITGLETKSDDNLVEKVRNFFIQWKDNSINGIHIKKVNPIFLNTGAKALLVTTSSVKTTNALVMGAKKYKKLNSHIKWVKFDPKIHFNSVNDIQKSGIAPAAHHKSNTASSMKSISPTGAQNKPNTTVLYDENDCLTVITGLETKTDDNLAKTVRKLITNWKDSRVHGNYIKSVERFPTFPVEEGKIPLLVTAVSAQNSQALLTSAETHLNPSSGIYWTSIEWFSLPTVPSKQDSIISEKQQISTSNDIPLQISDDSLNPDTCLSVIIGMETRIGDNLTKTVRKLVKKWNDSRITKDFINFVERYPNFPFETDQPLLVMATSAQNCQALVLSAQIYLHPSDGITWTKLTAEVKATIDRVIKNNQQISVDIPAPESYGTGLMAELSKECLKSASNESNEDLVWNRFLSQSLDKSLIDRKSVITGLETKSNEKVVDIVRKLVMDWKDPAFSGESIARAHRDPLFRLKDGKASITVTASDAQTSKALVERSKTYIGLSEGIQWTAIDPIDCLSVIIGLADGNDTKNPETIVRELVISWNDPSIFGSYVVDVQTDVAINGLKRFLVISASPLTCRALVFGSKLYLSPNSGIKWMEFRDVYHLNPVLGYISNDLKSNTVPKALDMTTGANHLKISSIPVPDKNLIDFSKTTVIESPNSVDNSVGIETNLNLNASSSTPDIANSEEQRVTPVLSDNNDNKFVVIGLKTRISTPIRKAVRNLVTKWKDYRIGDELIIDFVRRFPDYPKTVGEIPLLATVTDADRLKALIATDQSCMNATDGILWTDFKSFQSILADIQSTNEKPINWSESQLNLMDIPVPDINSTDTNVENTGIFANESPIDNTMNETLNNENIESEPLIDLNFISSSSPLNATNIKSQSLKTDLPIDNDRKSVITGLKTCFGATVRKRVRSLVLQWNDSNISGEFVELVERYPGFPKTEANVPLLVTATSAQTCQALVNGAKIYLKTSDGIAWTHYNDFEPNYTSISTSSDGQNADNPQEMSANCVGLQTSPKKEFFPDFKHYFD